MSVETLGAPRPMAKSDVCNVEPVSLGEVLATFRAIMTDTPVDRSLSAELDNQLAELRTAAAWADPTRWALAVPDDSPEPPRRPGKIDRPYVERIAAAIAEGSQTLRGIAKAFSVSLGTVRAIAEGRHRYTLSAAEYEAHERAKRDNYRRGQDDDRGQTDRGCALPTPGAIAEACAEIQRTWSPAERRRRQGRGDFSFPSAPMELAIA